jgi:hypothetical protein
MLSPLIPLILGLIVLLAALQLRLRWYTARHAAGKRGLAESVDPETRAPPESARLLSSYLDAPLLDYWGSPEPD